MEDAKTLLMYAS